MIRLISALAVLVSASCAASAHPGHIADVAGHSHWLGWAAVAGAGLLAAWLGTKGRKTNANETPAESEETAETAGEKA